MCAKIGLLPSISGCNGSDLGTVKCECLMKAF